MKKYKLYKIVFALLIILLTSQNYAQKSINKAKELMDNFQYVQAIEVFEKHFILNSPTAENLRDISFCYLETNDTKGATKWLKDLANSNEATKYDINIYADALKTQGDYQNAIKQYQKVAQMSPADKNKMDKEIESCQNAMKWTQEKQEYEVENAQQFNSSASDFGITIFEDKFISTSNRRHKAIYKNKEIEGWTDAPYYKLYIFDSEKNNYQNSTIGDLNEKFHDGPATYHEKSKTIYFTRTKSVKITQKPENIDPTSWYDIAKMGKFTNRLEIYSSKYENGEWTKAQAFKYNASKDYSVGHPAITKDGKTLYFVSDMPGGYGQSDIYYCELQNDGSWGKPINAGPKINSDKKEMFPTLDQNDNLYFSSNGHAGMGGLDIFKAIGKHNNWTEIENMKAPINSSKDDFLLVYVDDKMGYLSSNRDGGKGSDDIYSFFEKPEKVQYLVATVKTLDKETNKYKTLENAELTAHSFNKKGFVDITKSNNQFITKTDCIDTVLFNASKLGYYSSTKTVNINCDKNADTVYVELILEEIEMEIGTTIVLKNIYYDFDKWDIRPDAVPELDKVVELMKENQKIIVELGSHTDCRGTYAYNDRLSQRRSDSAVRYIIKKGISKNRITAKGYGEHKLLNNCDCEGDKTSDCSEEEHQLNRRTEFKVIGYTDEPIYSQQ